MEIKEIKYDIFELDDKYYLVHCVSSDYKLGSGIALDIENRFNIKQELNVIGSNKYPECILTGRIFNLVTKAEYFHKPAFMSLYKSLLQLKDMVKSNNIKYLAFPRIASCRDMLDWKDVKKSIIEIFEDINDIEIILCYI